VHVVSRQQCQRSDLLFPSSVNTAKQRKRAARSSRCTTTSEPANVLTCGFVRRPHPAAWAAVQAGRRLTLRDFENGLLSVQCLRHNVALATHAAAVSPGRASRAQPLGSPSHRLKEHSPRDGWGRSPSRPVVPALRNPLRYNGRGGLRSNATMGTDHVKRADSYYAWYGSFFPPPAKLDISASNSGCASSLNLWRSSRLSVSSSTVHQ
jgi:hypothetical protein